MNALAFVTAAAHFGAGGRPGPLPTLDSADLWPSVVDLAIEHRVAPLLSEALSKSAEGFAPSAVRGALQAELLRSGATRLLCESTLAQMVGILRGRRVEVIVLKGPTVAHAVYPRPELRIYHDIDVLCRVGDYPALHEALTVAGYKDAGTLEMRGTNEKLEKKPSRFESHSVRGFYDPTGDVKVEVHFDALQLGLFDRNEEQFWRTSKTRDVGGAEIRVLASEHQFLHLALHAHRHCYSRLSWLIELDLIVRKDASIDWDRLVQVARAEGIGTALRHALDTAHAVLGTPIPALPRPTLEELCLGPFYRALWPFARARTLSQHERHRLLHFLPDDEDPRNVLYGLVLMGRRREKLDALRRRRWPLGRRRTAAHA